MELVDVIIEETADVEEKDTKTIAIVEEDIKE